MTEIACLKSEEMTHGHKRVERMAELCVTRSNSAEEALFLFRIVRFLRPFRCLELGTCLGISAAYIATALKLNGAGHLISIEGCPTLVHIAKQNLHHLCLGNTTVRSDGMRKAWNYIANGKVVLAHAMFQGFGVCIVRSPFLTDSTWGLETVNVN